jgi:hypothetical protein
MIDSVRVRVPAPVRTGFLTAFLTALGLFSIYLAGDGRPWMS